MWNHKANNPGDGDLELNNSDSNVSLVDKVEKHLDLTNYLTFLHKLFNKPTSDTEESDNEANNEDEVQNATLASQSSNCANIQQQDKFLSSVAEESNIPGKSLDGLSIKPCPFDLSSSSSDSSSSFSPDEDSFMPSELTPMSDLDLNNLIRKTNYLGPDADLIPFELDDTSTTDSDNKKNTKKKKKKSKKKNDDGMNHRHNKPNSDGKGNGSGYSGYGGDSSGPGMNSSGSSNSTGSSNYNNSGEGSSSSKLSNNRARKQSLKFLRAEANNASCSSSGGEIGLKSMPTANLHNNMSVIVGKGNNGQGSLRFYGRQNGKIGFSKKFNSTPLSQALHNNATLNCSSSTIAGLPSPENLVRDDDDNNSLSDYISMAATAAATTAQVPPLPQHHLGDTGDDDSLFEFDENIMSNGCLNRISPALSSSVPIKDNNAPVLKSQLKELKKRKFNSTRDERDEPKTKKALLEKREKMIEMFNIKRKKIWVYICKKEIPKSQRGMVNTHKEAITAKRRLAQSCTRFIRQKAMQSQKVQKESIWRAKRLTREMQSFWKQADRVERDIRKRREKQAEEQRKLDVEIMEAKKQQRKLNFLITQTELYAHFMAKKLCKSSSLTEDEESKILCQLNEFKNEETENIDDYDEEAMKKQVKTNVENAFKSQLTQVKQYNIDCVESESNNVDEFSQPKIFEGDLKHYQLKGMNWLINLYNQGINGILGDEMGLGKTVQSISFLAHIAERCGIWGPFLVIAPASTLHNWQQELKRFVSAFKVVPYWGNPQERKILRQFWQLANLHTKEASFHVVVTSYQIVLADFKYLNKVKWQYLILDEAQAIKSTASTRWKTLLGFSCRNRLLLTGTPIQNTMGELWALLHFIMPSLFDCHDEFSEWFSKDVESHAENKSLMDERHLSRLHLILKPFMLRRIKREVENELSDKIEILVRCPLTSRQRFLYTVLKRKIKIEDLLTKSHGLIQSTTLAQHATTNLMNLVMQFRKVCNHPDLFERREINSPFHMKKVQDHYPRLIFRDGILSKSLPSKLHILENKFSVFNPLNTHRSLFSERNLKTAQSFPRRKLYKIEDINVDRLQTVDSNTVSELDSEWSFLRFIGMSCGDMWKLYCNGTLERLKQLVQITKEFRKIHHRRLWNNSEIDESNLDSYQFLLRISPKVSFLSFDENNNKNNTILPSLVFISPTDTFYTWKTKESTPKTLDCETLDCETSLPVITKPRKTIHPDICILKPTCMPKFLYKTCPKVSSEGREIYFNDPSAVIYFSRYKFCSSSEEMNLILNGDIEVPSPNRFQFSPVGGLKAMQPLNGWSYIVEPDREKLVTDSGKLTVLDNLLKKLKANGHRVLIYSQMTKMIGLLEEFMRLRKWTYIRLDGSSKISDRRDMVADFQSKSDIFVFLLSTRAGSLGINLTAADTVIFYDSDWNPTVDQQAMDRAHRLGQTKQVTVYRLICKGTVEERILQRAKEKNEIQRMVMSGVHFKPDDLKAKEVLSLLLDDDELERKCRQRQLERKILGVEKSVKSKGTSSQGLPSSESLVILMKHSMDESEKIEYVKRAKADIEVEPSLLKNIGMDTSYGESVEGSLPPSPNLSDELDAETRDMEFSESAFDEVNPSTSSYFDDYARGIDWNGGSVSDYEEDLSFIPKKPKIGRGTGKRGRPPSRRIHPVQMRETENGQLPIRRGPGRPRLRPIGPANQGIRGRRPGRPPLSKKAETISSSLTPLTPSQRVFGIYSSPDLNIS